MILLLRPTVVGATAFLLLCGGMTIVEASTAAAVCRADVERQAPAPMAMVSHPWNNATISGSTTTWNTVSTTNHGGDFSVKRKTQQQGVESPSTLPWMGAWKFEPGWFRSKHPWLPGFVARRVLASVLHLSRDSYHQVDDRGRPLKERRTLRVVSAAADRVRLVRTEGASKQQRQEVHFCLERRSDGHVYYVEEGLGEYRLLEHKEEEEEEEKRRTEV